MVLKIRDDLKYNKTIAILSILTVLFGVIAALTGEILLPFASAFLAALILFDRRSKYIVSVLISAVVLVSNILITYFVNGYWSALGLEIVLVACVIYFACIKGFNKAGSAAIVTLITSAFIVVSFATLAMSAAGEFSWSAVVDFYTKMYEEFRATFVEQITSLVQYTGETTELLFYASEASDMFDSMANMLISVVVLVGFLISGLTYKIFTAIVCRCADNPEPILKWRFITPSLYAYFYIALLIINVFLGSSTDVLALTLTNLYSIFMFVYAYVGFNFAYAILSGRRSRGFSLLVLAFALLFLSSFAIQLLSLIGVMFTLYHNKMQNTDDGISKD